MRLLSILSTSATDDHRALSVLGSRGTHTRVKINPMTANGRFITYVTRQPPMAMRSPPSGSPTAAVT